MDTHIKVGLPAYASCTTAECMFSTKYLRRYRTPEVKEKLDRRAQYKELLAAEAQRAYLSFLEEITEQHYAQFRDVVNKLAVADCLCSLALVAVQEGYIKPDFTERDTLEIVEGRHPMIEALRSDPFVPNTVKMGGNEPRSKIITGPNMGGKSSAVRMIALCAIVSRCSDTWSKDLRSTWSSDGSDRILRSCEVDADWVIGWRAHTDGWYVYHQVDSEYPGNGAV